MNACETPSACLTHGEISISKWVVLLLLELHGATLLWRGLEWRGRLAFIVQDCGLTTPLSSQWMCALMLSVTNARAQYLLVLCAHSLGHIWIAQEFWVASKHAHICTYLRLELKQGLGAPTGRWVRGNENENLLLSHLPASYPPRWHVEARGGLLDRIENTQLRSIPR